MIFPNIKYMEESTPLLKILEDALLHIKEHRLNYWTFSEDTVKKLYKEIKNYSFTK